MRRAEVVGHRLTPHPIVDRVTDGYLFHADTQNLVYNPDYGFLEQPNADPTSTVRTFIGFVALGVTPEHPDVPAVPERLISQTSFDQLPANRQQPGVVGKGVGLRIYSTPQATAGYPGPEGRDHRSIVGAYKFQIDPARILDERRRTDRTIRGKAARFMAHLGILRRHSREHDLAAITEEIHARQSGYDAVLINQPPAAALREWLFKPAHRHTSVDSAFMIIRNPNVPITLAALPRYILKRIVNNATPQTPASH